MDHAQYELCFTPIWYHYVGSYNYHPVQCSTTVLLFWLNDHISLFLQASHLCEKAKNSLRHCCVMAAESLQIY